MTYQRLADALSLIFRRNFDTYSSFSDICTKFYDLIVDLEEVANFVLSNVKPYPTKNSLFVGGFFMVAKVLAKAGWALTVVDYTDEMVEEDKKRLPGVTVEKADLKDLPYENQFECIFVIGRVFTHMLTSADVNQALQSLHSSRKPGGILFFDNYESSKIQVTNYFNVSYHSRRSINKDRERFDN